MCPHKSEASLSSYYGQLAHQQISTIFDLGKYEGMFWYLFSSKSKEAFLQFNSRYSPLDIKPYFITILVDNLGSYVTLSNLKLFNIQEDLRNRRCGIRNVGEQFFRNRIKEGSLLPSRQSAIVIPRECI